MSYCRWGPGCDLYIYADLHETVTIHVASKRRVLPHDFPANPMIELASGRMAPEDFTAAHKSYNARLGQCEIVDIGLSRDGESYRLDFLEAADLVADLRQEGYHSPQGVEDDIRADAEADPTCE